jgi:hypothetical protein
MGGYADVVVAFFPRGSVCQRGHQHGPEKAYSRAAPVDLYAPAHCLLLCILGILVEPSLGTLTRTAARRVNNEFGMPSSHSQFMFFFAAVYVLFVLVR